MTSGTSRFLWSMATRLSQYHANFLGGPIRWYGCETATGRPRQHHQAKKVCREVLEPVGDMPMSLLAYTAWTSPYVWTRNRSLQRHTLGDAVQSDFRGSHTGPRLNRCRRAVQHGTHTRFCDDPSLTVVPYRCQKSHSPVYQQLPRSHGLKPLRVW